MSGPKIVDMGKLPGGWQALQSASDSVLTFRRAEAMKLANESTEQDMALNQTEEQRRQADEERRAQAFDEETARLGEKKKQDAASRELNVDLYKEQVRKKITQGMMESSLRKGFPTPPPAALMETMKRRLDVVRNAGPDGQQAAIEWMQKSNEQDALDYSKRQLAVQIEDFQRLGVFGEDEAALGIVDELRDMVQDVDGMEDIAAIRQRVDVLRTEVKRQRKVDLQKARGDELIKSWAADVSPSDPRAGALGDIMLAWNAGEGSDYDGLVRRLFETKYNQKTAATTENLRKAAVELAYKYNFSDMGSGQPPTHEEVEAIYLMMQEQSEMGGAAVAQQTAPQAPAAARAAPTRSYEDARDEMVEALRNGDTEALKRLDAEVGKLTPEQAAEIKALLAPQQKEAERTGSETQIDPKSAIVPGDVTAAREAKTEAKQTAVRVEDTKAAATARGEQKRFAQQGPDGGQVRSLVGGNEYRAGPASMARAVSYLHLTGHDAEAANVIRWALAQPDPAMKAVAEEVARGFRGEDWLTPLAQFWATPEAFKKAYAEEGKQRQRPAQESTSGGHAARGQIEA